MRYVGVAPTTNVGEILLLAKGGRDAIVAENFLMHCIYVTKALIGPLDII